jgi:hypothetical protein
MESAILIVKVILMFLFTIQNQVFFIYISSELNSVAFNIYQARMAVQRSPIPAATNKPFNHALL